jgi:hypothetical protein
VSISRPGEDQTLLCSEPAKNIEQLLLSLDYLLETLQRPQTRRWFAADLLETIVRNLSIQVFLSDPTLRGQETQRQ